MEASGDVHNNKKGDSPVADPCCCVRGLLGIGIIIADFGYYRKSSYECDSSPIPLKTVFLVDGLVALLPLASLCCFCFCAVAGIAGFAAAQMAAKRNDDLEANSPGAGSRAVPHAAAASDSDSDSDSDSEGGGKNALIGVTTCALVGVSVCLNFVPLIWSIVGLLSLIDAKSKDDCEDEFNWYWNILIATGVWLLLGLPAMCKKK